MEVNGGVKGDVAVKEGFAAQRDEVAAHSEEHVGKEEGDGGGSAARDGHAHQRRLGEARRLSLEAVV